MLSWGVELAARIQRDAALVQNQRCQRSVLGDDGVAGSQLLHDHGVGYVEPGGHLDGTDMALRWDTRSQWLATSVITTCARSAARNMMSWEQNDP